MPSILGSPRPLWAILVVGLLLSFGSLYFNYRPRVIRVEKIVEKPVDRVVEKVVQQDCPKMLPAKSNHVQSPANAPIPSPGSAKTSSPPISQECAPGSNCAISNGQQGGITAGQVNIDTRQHLVLTDAQQVAITASMKPFSGRSAFILANGGTAELVAFGKRLMSALSNATIKSEFHTGVSMSEGGDAMPVLYIGYGDNDVDMAEALSKALIENHVLSHGQIGGHHYPGNSGMFQIHISPPS